MQKITLYIQPQLTNTTTAQDYVIVDMMEEDLITLTPINLPSESIPNVMSTQPETRSLAASLGYRGSTRLFTIQYSFIRSFESAPVKSR